MKNSGQMKKLEYIVLELWEKKRWCDEYMFFRFKGKPEDCFGTANKDKQKYYVGA